MEFSHKAVVFYLFVCKNVDRSLQVVTIKARTSGLLSKVFHVQHPVLVFTKARNLSFECPSLVVANEDYECVLSGSTGPIDLLNYTLNAALIDTAILPSKSALLTTVLTAERFQKNPSGIEGGYTIYQLSLKNVT